MSEPIWIEVIVTALEGKWKYDTQGTAEMSFEAFPGGIYSLESGKLLDGLIRVAARRYMDSLKERLKKEEIKEPQLDLDLMSDVVESLAIPPAMQEIE
jgi:hypothetical protein